MRVFLFVFLFLFAFGALQGQTQSQPACRTSTFNLEIPAPAGGKIEVNAVQSFPNSDFLIAGNVTTSNSREGLLVRTDHFGNILLQKSFRVSSLPVTLSQAKVLLDGRVVVGGIEHDATDRVFIALLGSDLQVQWVKHFSLPDGLSNMTLDLSSEGMICWAVQQGTVVFYSALSLTGEAKWLRQLPVQGLTRLVGFGMMSWIPFGIVCNTTRNGVSGTVLAEVEQSSGKLVSSHLLHRDGEELTSLAATSFVARQAVLSVAKTGSSSFQLQRTIHFSSGLTETRHTFTAPEGIDFSATGAMDAAGDAIGIVLPDQGKLVFIKQFCTYNTAPEFTRVYDVPSGSSLASLTRSFDGGFLFGINGSGGASIVLLKTDSTGTLPGCGFTSPPNSATEVLNSQNQASAEASIDAPAVVQDATLSFADRLLSANIRCRQAFCPPAPAGDTCLQTFYKSFRSTGFTDFFSNHHLLRNNRHLIVHGRYDRVLGGSNQVTTALRLFSEGGQFLKGVTVQQGGSAAVFSTRKMTDSTVMIISYTANTPNNGPPAYTFTLVNDNLEPLWSKSFVSEMNAEFTSGGTSFSDLVRDREGNYYFIGARGGFMETKPGLAVYKMNAAGDPLWLKAYAVETDYGLGFARGETTDGSLLLFVEGSRKGLSMRLDKSTGAMQGAFSYNIGFDGGMYHRVAERSGDRILYGGSTKEGRFVMAAFDTLGKALKIREIENSQTIRAGDVAGGSLFACYDFFNGSTTKTVLLKADAALNVGFLYEYDQLYPGHEQSLSVSEDGSIYVVGNDSYGPGNHYMQPYLKKLSAKGESGTCAFQPRTPVLKDIDPQVTALSTSPLTKTFHTAVLPVTLVADTAAPVVSAIHCSSVAQCSFLKISGPEALCGINASQVYSFKKDGQCTLRPMVVVDTVFAEVEAVSDTAVRLRFKRPGTTWIKAGLNAGCQRFADSIQIRLSNAPAVLDLGADSELCPGNTLVLNARSGYTTYRWQNGSVDSTLTVSAPGQYYVTATDACGGVFTDTVNVLPAPPVSLDAGPDRTLCQGDTLRLSAPAGFLSYTWSNNYHISSLKGPSVTVAPTVDTAYFLAAEKTPGCFGYDTVRVKVYRSLSIELGADRSFCSGDSIQWNAGGGFALYRWSTGAATQHLTAKSAGSYWVVGTTAEGCQSSDTVRVVQVYPLPQVRLGQKAGLCQGETSVLDPGSYVSYLWQDGSTGRTFTATGLGRYSVAVTDHNGCQGSDTTAITVLHPLPAGFLPADTAICSYGSLELKPSKTFQNYLWSTGSRASFLTITQPGLYSLIVTDENNCTGKDTVLVSANDCLSGVYVPTAFTPNGDGKNDSFRPLLFGRVKQFRFTVYNRWGEVVFQTTELQKGWDGKVAGVRQESSTFVWTCAYQLEGEAEKMQKGTITVIR